MKILIVVPPLTGHINPAIAVARLLRERGHEVQWAATEAVLRHHFSEEENSYYQVEDLPSFELEDIVDSSHTVRGLGSVKYFYEEIYLPLARNSFEALDKFVESYQPDLIISDHQMFSGALVARKHDIPWLASITTSASIIRLLESIEVWIIDNLQKLCNELNFTCTDKRVDFSPHGNIVFSTLDLIGSERDFVDAPFHFVGPCINTKRPEIEFPWDWLDSNKKKILVSLGTVSLERTKRFYHVIMDALADEQDIQVIMAAREEWFNEIPENFIIQAPVPQLELLKEVDLVVSHAGHNTVCETLYEGLPMIVAPIRDDQPVIAGQVVDAGAGLSLRFGKVSSATARDKILKVLGDDAYKEAAAKIQESFKNAHKHQSVVSIIEELGKQ